MCIVRYILIYAHIQILPFAPETPSLFKSSCLAAVSLAARQPRHSCPDWGPLSCVVQLCWLRSIWHQMRAGISLSQAPFWSDWCPDQLSCSALGLWHCIKVEGSFNLLHRLHSGSCAWPTGKLRACPSFKWSGHFFSRSCDLCVHVT